MAVNPFYIERIVVYDLIKRNIIVILNCNNIFSLEFRIFNRYVVLKFRVIYAYRHKNKTRISVEIKRQCTDKTYKNI